MVDQPLQEQLAVVSHLLYTLTQDGDGDEGSGEDDSDESSDPCNHYTALDQTWRATNYTTKNVACDRRVQWKGWYRLFYRGKPIQMPERCVKKEMCGTHAPLWLVGGHPRIRDGVVTRKVCGNWKNNCCLFKSPPIQVKACRGNYYVYKFVKPVACHMAYCAGKIQCKWILRKI
uniref:Si:ch73-180n10.1 n=1 Tax=Sinocyclocheilus grahami TaxID=75366 RepID=A0A672M027_SINGR